MALKDHSLDDKITAAAMKEFSAKGYNGASLRRARASLSARYRHAISQKTSCSQGC